MEQRFIHLNIKSEYSLLNSIVKTDDLIKTVSGFNDKCLALTDLNNMHNAYHFEQKCKKAGVKSILGITFCIKYKYKGDYIYGNLTLLAKDNTGYKNLVYLSTIANTGSEHTGKEGFPFLTLEQMKDHTSSLFCLTGGTSGIFFKLFIQHDWKEMKGLLQTLSEYFPQSLYFEMQDHGIPAESSFIRSKEVKALLDDADIDTVATNDVYYMKQEYSYHRGLALEMNPNPNGIEFTSSYVNYNDQWYLKSEQEMIDTFAPYLDLYPNILSNTIRIAEACKASVPVEKALPEFPIPEGYTNESYLREMVERGFEERFGGRTDIDLDKYHERLDYEFGVIKKMGFIDYHLITADFIQWAKDDKVYEHPERYFPKDHYPDYSKIPEKLWKKDYEILVGPGRGSAAGSLLCYCLKITNLDPIKYGLLFERFLNVERVSMPDIDVDFPNNYRYDVVEYVQGKYGYEKVCQIATFQTLGVKSIIKSVGKVQGLTFDETNKMTGEVPDKEVVEEPDDDGNIQQVEKKIELLSQLEKYDYFKEKIRSDNRVAELFRIGKVLEGLPSATGKHAAGVIIARKPLMNYVPLMEVDGVMVSQFEKKAVESIGLLKMDFLGLQTLDVLAETLRLIKENYGKKLSLNDIPVDDKDTYVNIFQKAKTNKVFQFESAGMQKLLLRMKPTCLMDLCLANAAYRPGPLQFIDEFIQGRKAPDSVKYPTKEYETIAKETSGILFYQEQVMQIVQAMAGFTLGEADILRRGIGKKEKKYIDDGRKQFIKGCLKLGTADEKTAKYIYSTIEKFANYGFNKSHSAAYGLVAYLCGYLKQHYPTCFMAANSTINSHNVDKLAVCLAEIERMHIPLLLPDVRYSKSHFVLEQKDGKEAIRFSLAAIKSIREEMAEQYIESKDKSSMFGFLCGLPKNGIRKNQITNLIYAGAFDYLGKRKALVDNLDVLIEATKAKEDMDSYGMPNILSMLSLNDCKGDVEYSAVEKLEKEKSCIQIALSGHPITPYRNLTHHHTYIIDYTEQIEETGEVPEEDVTLFAYIANYRPLITKKGTQMAFCTLDDEYSDIDGVIFSKTFKIYEKDIRTDIPCEIVGNFRTEENIEGRKVTFVIREIHPVKSVGTLYILKEDMSPEFSHILQQTNGILPIFLVDTKTFHIEKLPYMVDITPSVRRYLKKTRYIIKNQRGA